MTTYSFDSFAAASAFAKRISKENKISVHLVKRLNEYIVEGEYPSAGIADLETDTVSVSHAPDVQVRKEIATSLDYGAWVKEQGIEKSESAEKQWWEAYKAGKESTHDTSDDSIAKKLAGKITASVSNTTATPSQPTSRPVKPKKPSSKHVTLSTDTRLCISCGVVIPQARVEAYPNVSRCIKCQSTYEQTHDTRPRGNEGFGGTREENIRMRYRGGS